MPDMPETKATRTERPVAMTIAGSDSGGGAGIQADLLTFDAYGVHGTSAVTCLTAQNPESVSKVIPASAEFVREQMLQVTRYFNVPVVKTGMLYSEEIIGTVASFLEDHPAIQAVVDPVMVATSGALLLQDSAIESLKARLLSRAELITPNLDEAGVLAGKRPGDILAMIETGRRLQGDFGCAVLMKGGHLEGEEVLDVLVDGSNEPAVFKYRRLPELNTHGSGCIFSAAIAAALARGDTMSAAVADARAFLHHCMLAPKALAGNRFIDPSAARKVRTSSLSDLASRQSPTDSQGRPLSVDSD